MKHNNHVKRRILLVSSLLLAVLVSTLIIQNLFCMPDFEDENRIRRFHNEPSDTLDMVIIGSSDVYTGYSAALAYKDYGIRSYPYAISGETCLLWKSMVKDILRTQSPEIIFIETYGAGYSDKHLRGTAAEAFKLLDTMPLSIDKCTDAVRLSNETDESDALSFMLPFIKYHGRYGAYFDNFSNLRYIHRTKTSPLKGVHNKSSQFKAERLIDLTGADEVIDLSKKSEAAVIDFLEYCKGLDTKIVFISFPSLAKEEGSFMYNKHLRSNMTGKLAEDYGFDYINLQNMSHEMGISPNEDFYDYGHANIYGQKKITSQICRIMLDRYNIKAGTRAAQDSTDALWKQSADLYNTYYRKSDEYIHDGKKYDFKDDRETLDLLR